MNNVQLTGRLTKSATMIKLDNGTQKVTFIIAVDKGLSKEKKEEYIAQGKATADFIPITVFGKVAENCIKYTEKGSQVIIDGKISTSNYTTNTGEKKYSMNVIADRIEFIWSKEKSTQENSIETTDESYAEEIPL